MFLNMSRTLWVAIGICILAAFFYAAVIDWIEHRTSAKAKDAVVFSREKYLAIALCVLIAIAATVIGQSQGYVGAPMAGLMIGILLVNVAPDGWLSKSFKAGTTFAGKRYLSLGIVCIGATLSLTNLFGAVYALPLVLFNILLSFAVAYLAGKKLLHVSTNTCTLVGGGTCVCGGTAIAALSPIVKAKEEETAYAMAAIFLFDLLACLSYPYLALRLGFSEVQFGFLAGTAINDTSSVVAAQETFANLMNLSSYALPATIKVVRTAMIIVLVLVFSMVTMRQEAGTTSAEGGARISLGKTMWRAFPKFILVFLAMVALNTVLSDVASEAAFYKDAFKPFFSNGYKFFVTIALAGVGFKIKFKDLFTKGLKPIALGGCAWLALFLSSLTFSLLFAEQILQ